MSFSRAIWMMQFLAAWITLNVSTEPTCYNELGCFPTNYPWFTLLRPFPAPQNVENVNTTFTFSNREDMNGTLMKSWQTIQLPSKFDNHKSTYFVTHGYASNSNTPWFKNLTEAILSKSDGNMFTVDWSKGSSTGYFQAAANTRMVAAEIQRVIRHLITAGNANTSMFHLLGHSLGAHIMSYVAKNIRGIGRITALDPAQPGFQGRNAIVRLNESDADFIDVVHTDGRPFLPHLGLGMSDRVGKVDFFVNGGKYQPNCILDGENFMYKSFKDVPRITLQVLYNLATCSHSRAPRYMAAAIKENCIFGFRYNATSASLMYKNFIIDNTCDINSCTVMGLDTPNYPALGNFAMNTDGTYPFCVTNKEPARNIGLKV